MKTVKELQRELDEAIERERDEGKAELAAVVPEYDWTVEWESQHVFRCTRKFSAETLETIDALREKYPKLLLPYGWDRPHAEGMEYILIGLMLTHVGGGTLVLNTGSQTDIFSHEPVKITNLQRNLLKRGIVPTELRRSH